MTYAPQPHPGQPQQGQPQPMQQQPMSQPQPGQFPPQHAPAQQPHPGQQVPMGSVQFTIQGNFMTSSFIPPRVLMNGYQIAVPNLGSTTVPVPAGPVAVEANQVYIYGPYGQAGLHITVAPGQTVPVFYAPPYVLWAKGRMGVEPQERQGLGWFIGMFAGIFAVPLVIAGIAITIGLMS